MLTKKKKYAKNPVELWRTTKLFNKEKKKKQQHKLDTMNA